MEWFGEITTLTEALTKKLWNFFAVVTFNAQPIVLACMMARTGNDK